MADQYPDYESRYYTEERERDRFARDRGPRGDRGLAERASDEVRSWFGDEDAASRRRMDERRPARDERAHGDRGRSSDSRWDPEPSVSSDRAYGDRDYGWRGRERGYSGAAYRERGDYPDTWRSRSTAGDYPGQFESHGATARSSNLDYGRGYDYGRSHGDETVTRRPTHETTGEGSRGYRDTTAGWYVPGPHAGRGPRGYQRSDQRIVEDLNDRLTAHGLIDATDVECRVQNGEVTLAGFVDSRAAKRAAEDVAEDIPGVREVHNHLRVRSHAEDQGVGRTSVLGLTESQVQTPSATNPTDSARSRTRG